MGADAVALYPIDAKVSGASAQLVGAEGNFPDLDYNSTTPGPRRTLSGMMVDAVLVKNAGSALSPGTVVKWSVPGKEVNGVAGADEVGAGVVSPYIVGTVATDELFWLIRKGPVEVLSSAAISAGAAVKTAADGKAVTNPKAVVADLAAGFGIQIDAATAADQLKRTLVDFRDA